MLILLDNKKPAKPYDLRVFVFLCTALNLDLGRGPVSNCRRNPYN